MYIYVYIFIYNVYMLYISIFQLQVRVRVRVHTYIHTHIYIYICSMLIVYSQHRHNLFTIFSKFNQKQLEAVAFIWTPFTHLVSEIKFKSNVNQIKCRECKYRDSKASLASNKSQSQQQHQPISMLQFMPRSKQFHFVKTNEHTQKPRAIELYIIKCVCIYFYI